MHGAKDDAIAAGDDDSLRTAFPAIYGRSGMSLHLFVCGLGPQWGVTSLGSHLHSAAQS